MRSYGVLLIVMICPCVISWAMPAAGDHQDQRRDDRLDPDHGHEDAVPEAEEHRQPERGGDRDEHAADAVLVVAGG